MAGKVEVAEARHQAALALLKRAAAQAVPHERRLEQERDDKGGQQAAHSQVKAPGVLALGGAVHRHKPHDEQHAPHLCCGGGWGRGRGSGTRPHGGMQQQQAASG